MIQDGYINGEYVGKVSSKRIEDINSYTLTTQELFSGNYDKELLSYDYDRDFIKVLKDGMNIKIIDNGIYNGLIAIRLIDSKINRLEILELNKGIICNVHIVNCEVKSLRVNKATYIRLRGDTICNIEIEDSNLIIEEDCRIGNILFIVKEAELNLYVECGGKYEYNKKYMTSNIAIDKIEVNGAYKFESVGADINKLIIKNSVKSDIGIYWSYIGYGIVDTRKAIIDIDNITSEKGKITVKAEHILLSELITLSDVKFISNNIDYECITAISANYITKKELKGLKERIVITDGMELDLDYVDENKIEYVKTPGKEEKPIISIRKYIGSMRTIKRLILTGLSIRTLFGTQAYYALLSNGVQVELIDKIPDNVISKAAKIRLMYGSIVDRILDDYDDRDYVELPAIDYKGTKIPSIVCKEIQFLRNFEHLDRLDVKDLTVLSTEVIGNVVVESIRLPDKDGGERRIARRFTELIHNKKAVILEIIIIPDTKYSCNYICNNSNNKFFDEVANYVMAVSDVHVEIKNFLDYDKRLDKINKMRDMLIQIDNITTVIEYSGDKYYACSKGFIKFSKEDIGYRNRGIVEVLDT